VQEVEYQWAADSELGDDSNDDFDVSAVVLAYVTAADRA
jgi:hypothetical protein